MGTGRGEIATASRFVSPVMIATRDSVTIVAIPFFDALRNIDATVYIVVVVLCRVCLSAGDRAGTAY